MEALNAPNVDPDIAVFSRLEVVPKLLKLLSQLTGLRIALVARVSDEGWTACAILDNAGLGFKPGDKLDLHDTY